MSVELNEYCWLAIFEYLRPIDWIRIAEVSPHWRRSVSRIWKKIGTKICITDTDNSYFQNYENITPENAQKMLLLMIPHTKSLTIELETTSPPKYYINLPTREPTRKFRVKSPCPMHLNETLQLLANNATELREVRFESDVHLSLEDLELLFRENKIQKVTADVACMNVICGNDLTDSVKELKCFLRSHKTNCKSFEEDFKNVEKFEMLMVNQGMHKTELEHYFSQYLPYLKNLKSFTFSVPIFNGYPLLDMVSNGFEHILTLSNMEELSIDLQYTEVQSMEAFVKKLVSRLPKLRSVNIIGFAVNNSVIATLLKLEKLEKLSIELEASFCAAEFPTAPNVTEIKLCLNNFDNDRTNSCTSIVNAIKKMPNIEHVSLHKIRGINHKQFPIFFAQLIYLTQSQFKTVAVKTDDIWDSGNGDRKIILKNKFDDNVFDHDEMLQFVVSVPLHTLETLEKEINLYLAGRSSKIRAYII